MEKHNAAKSVVEERDATLVLSNGSQTPIKSKGFFLNPTSSDSDKAFSKPNFVLSKSLKNPKYRSNFRWWADPQLYWDKWIKKLEPKYTHLWQKLGIFHAIMSSKYKFLREPNALLGVSRFWCDETNTFMFPWGEATITLEDVMILGGFPVLGEPVRIKHKLEGELEHMESLLIQELSNIKRKRTYPRQSFWIDRHMNRVRIGGGDIEHAAFLALWLSRFVLMSSERNVNDNVFQVAVRLAKGIKVALAPAVLASIYKSLSTVKNHVSRKTPDTTSLAIWAPMHILQFWVWERFPRLSPGVKVLTSFDIPRAARWLQKPGKISSILETMQILKSPDEFTWRPYVKDMENWSKPSFYLNEGEWLCSGETRDEGLRSFAQCLIVSWLVGLDCIEQYQPHRVARQFGFSQDIPCFVLSENFRWEDAWETYDISLKNVKYYIPSSFYIDSYVTVEYFQWWRRWQGIQGGKRRKTDEPICNKTKKRTRMSVDEPSCNRRVHFDLPDLKVSETGNEKNMTKEEEEMEDEQEKIARLKAEIAEIEAKIKKLESEAEANPNPTAVFFSS